jgi:hypothetical protein
MERLVADRIIYLDGMMLGSRSHKQQVTPERSPVIILLIVLSQITSQEECRLAALLRE